MPLVYFLQPCMLCNGLAKVNNHNRSVILGCKYGHVGQVIQLWYWHRWKEQVKKCKTTQKHSWRLVWFAHNEFLKRATFYYSRMGLDCVDCGTNFTASWWQQITAKNQCFCWFQLCCTLSTLIVQYLNGDQSDFDNINAQNSQFSPSARAIWLRGELYRLQHCSWL